MISLIQKSESEHNCYLCLEKINYFHKFDCSCHNYVHTHCIKNNLINDCLICKKKIHNLTSLKYIDNMVKNKPDIFNMYYSDLILVHTSIILEILIIPFKLYPNVYTFLLYIIFNLLFVFVIILPSMFVNIIYNICKIYLLDLCLLILFTLIPIVLVKIFS